MCGGETAAAKPGHHDHDETNAGPAHRGQQEHAAERASILAANRIGELRGSRLTVHHDDYIAQKERVGGDRKRADSRRAKEVMKDVLRRIRLQWLDSVEIETRRQAINASRRRSSLCVSPENRNLAAFRLGHVKLVCRLTAVGRLTSTIVSTETMDHPMTAQMTSFVTYAADPKQASEGPALIARAREMSANLARRISAPLTASLTASQHLPTARKATIRVVDASKPQTIADVPRMTPKATRVITSRRPKFTARMKMRPARPCFVALTD